MKAAGIVDAVGPTAKAQVTQRSPQRQFGRGGCGIHCGISTHGIRDGRHQICGDFGEGWFDQLHHYGKRRFARTRVCGSRLHFVRVG